MTDQVGTIKIAPWEEEARAINILLEDRYGLDTVRRKARYRVVWSTNQIERRFGRYDIYYMQHVFLRTEVGTLDVPKYQDFPDCWVLENFIYAPIAELPESKQGHYEVLYAFLSQKREPLEPLFRVCEIVIWMQRNPYRAGELVNILHERDKKFFNSEVAYFKDVLDDENRSWLWTDPHATVVVPKNYETPERKIIPGVIGSTKGEI